MRLVYRVCYGVDVHKKTIVATIVTTDKNNVSTYLQKTFSTINSDLERFHHWLKENNCYHVCMESTGKYWIPIFNVLESDIHVILTHPKYVKAIKGFNLGSDQPFKMSKAKDHLEYLEQLICDTEIKLYNRY